MMRHLTILLLLALAIGCKPKSDVKRLKPTQTVATQTISFSDEALEQGLRDTIDFGKMRQGEIIAKNLRLDNNSDHPIVMLRHVTTCGCVNVLYQRKPIAPNSSTTIEFELDSKSLHGWQLKLMEFYFADQATPMKIYLEAEVE